MSVSVTKSSGVMVLTMTSDTGSACPPLCQILQALCYSPVCCSVSQKLRLILGTSHSALGMMQVMVGLMNIGLGAILHVNGLGSSWIMDFNHYPFWMGALFIIFGVLCILSEKFPSLCLVVSSVSAQMAGIVFSITAVVLYSINQAEMYIYWPCQRYDYYDRQWGWSTPTPINTDLQKCLEGLSIIKTILCGVNVLLIILSVLQLCLSISCVVLGIRAMKKGLKKENQSEDIENYTPLLDDKPSH
ncbi:unnamed protein product [Lota lota]